MSQSPGINMHGLVRGVITAINRDETVTYKMSIGSTTLADGSRSANFASPIQVTSQWQQLSNRDLRQVEGLSLNGKVSAVYLYGQVDAIVRSAQKGGDLMVRADGSVWLVNQVLEDWEDGTPSNPTWCKIAATLQNNA